MMLAKRGKLGGLVFLVMVAFCHPSAGQALNPPPQPRWIWSDVEGGTQAKLTRQFEIEAPVVSARITMATRSTQATLLVDNRVVADLQPYDPLLDQTIPITLDEGTHQLTILAKQAFVVPAIFARIELELEQGQRRTIVTDGQWMHAEGAAYDYGPVPAKLIIPAERHVTIGATENYEQWKQALGDQQGPDPASFLLPPGFDIHLVRSAAPDEDSWVSMEFDPQGRLVIAKEKAGLLRMQRSADGNSVTRVESFADDLQECRGLAFIGDTLYANANNSKALFRLAKLDDGFAEPEQLFASTGDVGHGRNDLAVGPDGMLYFIHGDAVDIPTGVDVADYTSPFREARQGQTTREGHLLRIDPSDGRVEVLAAGLRNPFGIDFNPDGELFTYDADAEFDMGAPWYRPTRVNHLMTGADFGWRGVTGSWPPYYPDHPDNAPAGLEIGKGSPTAVKFGTNSKFPGRFREALFILDWAYGRIIAVHMDPRGASYLMAAETFLKGRPLNVTDLAFAPDGSMYLVTGGRQTQSALYRVMWTGEVEASDDRPASIARGFDALAKQSRHFRQKLESQLSKPADDEQLKLAWHGLSMLDPAILYAARNLLEHQPISTWADRALQETKPQQAAHSLLALARTGQAEWRAQIVSRLNELLPTVSDRDVRAAMLYAYWLCLQDPNWLDGTLREETLSVLNEAYPSLSPTGAISSHNWLLSEMLVDLGHPDAVAKSIQLLNRADGQHDQMHYLHVLRRATQGWTITERRDYFAALAQARHYLTGAGMDGFLKQIREEAVATLSESERNALQEALAGPSSDPTNQPSSAAKRPRVRQWKMEDFSLADAASESTGDPKRGAKVFREATCAACHRFGSQGTLVGPDLTSAAGRFNRRDLLMSILEPSKVIAENYRAVQIVTTDGRSYTGLATMIGDYRSPYLRLATNPAAPLETIEIAKTDIESQKVSSVSWMPTGLLDHFTLQEIEDLLAYLRSTP